MPKSLFLLIVAVLLGTGVAIFAWKSNSNDLRTVGAPPVEAQGGQDSSAPVTTDPDAELVGVIPASEASADDLGGPAKSWQVIPMNAAGQMLKAATVRATHPGTAKELTGTGRIRWDAPPSGEWVLAVEAEGLPNWESTVTLREGKREMTPAYLGTAIRIRGTLVDLNGHPVTGIPAYFLPANANHPGRDDMEREGQGPRGPLVPNNGAIPTKLGAKGEFQAVLPEAGKWRFSVGAPGKARWTQPAGTPLKNGGPNTAVITIPARGTLRLEFESPVDERPNEVVVYTFNSSRQRPNSAGTGGVGEAGNPDAKIVERDLAEMQRLREAALSNLSPAEREALTQKIIGRSLNDSSDWAPPRTAGDPGAAQGDDRSGGSPSSPLEEGWRALRSVRPDPTGETLISNLPTRADLRFMFVRGTERIVTPGAQQLALGAEIKGTVFLPPLGTGPPVTDSNPRPVDARASVLLQAPDPATTQRQIGVVWE
jgi:hypothetical protein